LLKATFGLIAPLVSCLKTSLMESITKFWLLKVKRTVGDPTSRTGLQLGGSLSCRLGWCSYVAPHELLQLEQPAGDFALICRAC
jgi:hypothetical protein